MKSSRIENKGAALLAVGFLVAVTVGIYLQTRSYDFVGYDDDRYVTENAQVQKGLTQQGVLWAFTSVVLGNWHPVTWLSHMTDVQLFGMNPGAHHSMNVFLHLLNTLLLFFVMQTMTGEIWKSFMVAVFFAVHPLHVESVAWVAERKDLLSAFFWMLTLLCYVFYTRRLNRSMYLLSFLFFILGLMSKPMLVTLPFVLLLLDYWPLKRFQFTTAGNDIPMPGRLLNLRFLVQEKIPFFLFSFLSCLLTFFAQRGGGAVGSWQKYPFGTRVANALTAYAEYIAKMFWPTKMAVLYPHPGALPFWKVSLAVLILASVFYVSLRHARKYPWACVGWLWYLGTLVPVIGLVQVGVQSMADRYTYIPLIGLFVMIAWGFPELLSTCRRRRLLLFPAAAAVVLLLSITAWYQVRHWSNSISLFEHAISVTDGNYIMHNNLGFELQAKGRAAEALEQYSTAIRLNPKFADAHLNIGVILAGRGNFEAAAGKLHEALHINPNFVRAHLNLGYVRLHQGSAGEALKHYARALQLDSASVDAYNGLGVVMLMIGKYEKAIAYFRKALILNPDDVNARKNLNHTLAAQKKLPQNEGFQDPRVPGFE